MGKVVTVEKTSATYANWLINISQGGQHITRYMINGDEGQAAAAAINHASTNGNAQIVAPEKVMKIINKSSYSSDNDKKMLAVKNKINNLALDIATKQMSRQAIISDLRAIANSIDD